MADDARLHILERQLAVFAQEFHDRMDMEEGLRQQVAAAHTVLTEQLAELRDVYLMHKRHLEESIELISVVRGLADQLDSHVARGYVTLNTSQAATWYKTFRLMSKQSAKALVRQKKEIAPYLSEDWKPPAVNTWDGQLEKLADQPIETATTSDKRSEPTPKA